MNIVGKLAYLGSKWSASIGIPIAHCGPAQILVVGVDITAKSFHPIFRIYLTSCFLFLVPGRYCLHLAHTTPLAKSCQHPWMLSTWSVASPVIDLFLYLNYVLCLVSSWIPEYWFYFLLGPSISLVSSFLSGHPIQILTLASSLYPLKTGTCRISQCVFMWKFMVSLVCGWVEEKA